MALPVVIFRKKENKQVIPVATTTSDKVEQQIINLCNGNKKERKHYDYVMYDISNNTIFIGKQQPIEEFFESAFGGPKNGNDLAETSQNTKHNKPQ